MSTAKARLSDRLSSFFDWHRRRKADKQEKAEASGEEVANISATPEAEPQAPEAAPSAQEPAQPKAAAEPVKAATEEATAKPAKRDRGYNEMMTLLDDVREHMQHQANRSERLLQVMEGLPEALQNLPETNRNQVRILEAIEGHLDQQTQNQSHLTNAINGLSRTTETQEQNIGIIKEHLGRQEQTDQQMLTSFSSLTNTLGKLNESSQASAKSLQQLTDRGEEREHEMRDLFKRNQKQMAAMSAVSWALALVALAVAGFVALSVSQQMTSSSGNAASPANVAAPAGAADQPAGPEAQGSNTSGAAEGAEAGSAAPTTESSSSGQSSAPAETGGMSSLNDTAAGMAQSLREAGTTLSQMLENPLVSNPQPMVARTARAGR
jgi:hypothetical protein